MLEAESFLLQRGTPYRLIELKDRAMTVADVARYSKGDIKIEEICKTIIISDSYGGLYAFFLLGVDQIDLKKAERHIGRKLSIASPDQVRDATGVDPGAVCPLTLKVPLIIDVHIMKLPRINFGSGHHLHGIEMNTSDFLQVIPHTIVNITQVA